MEQSDAKKRERVRDKPSKCDDKCNVSRAQARLEVLCTLHGFPIAAAWSRDCTPTTFFSRDLGIEGLPVPSNPEQQQLLQSRLVAGSLLLEARMERGQGRDGAIRRLQNQPHQSRSRRSASRIFCTMSRTTCSRLQSSPNVVHRKHLPSTPQKGNAAHEAMEAATQARKRQEEARLVYEQKCQDAAEAETIFNGTIWDTLEKTGALEKHVRTVTTRAEPLATTEADFFTTLLNRQEETQKDLNELFAQLCQTCSAQRETRRAKRQAHEPASAHTEHDIFVQHAGRVRRVEARISPERGDTCKTSVRLGRLTHGSSRDIQG